MNENAFDNFWDNPDNGIDPPAPLDSKSAIPSRFTIVIDSNEQQPYEFLGIEGDAIDDYAPIKVRTKKMALRANKKRVGDYGILECPGFCIERKTKSDLFSSVNDRQKQENFIERLRNMSENLKGGAIIIECYQRELFDDPPSYTKFSPKAVYRMTLSWGIQFPLIAWHFAEDRTAAEHLTYRLLEKFYQHETDVKYKHHNKPIDRNLEAMKQGVLARVYSSSTEIPYCEGNPLRVSWLKGWELQSSLMGGQRGDLYELGKAPGSSSARVVGRRQSSPAEKKLNKTKSDQHVPLPGQTSFLEEALDGQLGKLFEQSLADHPAKKRYKGKNF